MTLLRAPPWTCVLEVPEASYCGTSCSAQSLPNEEGRPQQVQGFLPERQSQNLALTDLTALYMPYSPDS